MHINATLHWTGHPPSLALFLSACGSRGLLRGCLGTLLLVPLTVPQPASPAVIIAMKDSTSLPVPDYEAILHE